MTRVVFHPEAEAELVAAAQFYELHSRGLGLDFIAEVRRATRAVATYPRIGQRFSKNLRRALVRRFPYGLLYELHADALVIVAVAHLRRRPGHWRHR